MISEDPLPSYDFKAGALLLANKPKTWTSFDVVNKIRYQLKHTLGVKKIKVGHSGTLDPLATGLLIICTGKFTKKLNELQGLTKEYTGTFYLGCTTPSFDAESEVDQRYPTEHITRELIEEKKAAFLGEIDQVPPTFSAIKVDGQPLYKKARAGKKVKVEARRVTIYDFEFQRFELPELDFIVKCSKGTYIRSLAHDFGKALNSGAYLSALCRTKIGDFRLEDAWELDELVKHIQSYQLD